MKRFLLVLLIVSMSVVAHAAPLPPDTADAAAQTSPVNSLTFSETTINQLLRANIQEPGTDFSIDLQPGQMVIRLVVTGQNGNVTTFTLTLVPILANGQLDFEATSFSINDLVLPIDNNNRAANDAANGVNSFLNEQTGGGQISNIVITDSEIRLEWTNPDPTAPAVNIRDNILSLTFNESAVNAMPWVTNPTDPNVQSLNVDFQPGQAVLNVTQRRDPNTVAYAIIPRTVNNRVTWQVTALADTPDGVAANLITLWQAYFGSLYEQGGLMAAIVTEDTMTFTWDLNAQTNPTPGEPVSTIVINEADVNAALAAYTTDELISLTVDTRPGEVVFTAIGLSATGEPYSATATMVPVIRGGDLTWMIDELTLNGFVLAGDALGSVDDPTGAITQGFNGNPGGSFVNSIEITDTDVTVVVTYR